MTRSTINQLFNEASDVFRKGGWVLPSSPAWDITDFGLNDIAHFGLVLINLASEPEYCEKLMYARPGMATPAHAHKIKKEDIICRQGVFEITLWADTHLNGNTLKVKIDGEWRDIEGGMPITINAGSRITIFPTQYHQFAPIEANTIIGEVSTANDDTTDNYFIDRNIGRYSIVVEDEPASVKLLSDK